MANITFTKNINKSVLFVKIFSFLLIPFDSHPGTNHIFSLTFSNRRYNYGIWKRLIRDNIGFGDGFSSPR